MRRTSSLGLSLSVCGAVAALAVGPAHADDGVTVPVDPTAIVAAVAAAVPSMPEPQGPAAPQLPTAPETSVIPLVPAPVPPVIPPAAETAAPPQATSSEPPAVPATTAAPVAAAQPEPIPTPEPAPVPTAAPSTSDTGNTTADNSNSITDQTPTTAPQTFVWNWYWNCSTDEGTPSVPSPPPSATTIVLNWHWTCTDPPPRLDVAGVTVCVSCNIAISVRVGSPGNTGDLAQTIAAQTQAAATGIAQTIQTALQAAAPVAMPSVATPLPPTPPAVILPSFAPPTAVSAVASAAHLYPLDAGALAVTLDATAADDPPLHGAPSSYGAAPAPRQLIATHDVASGVVTLAAFSAFTAPGAVDSPQRSTVGRTGAGSRSHAGARRPPRGPAVPTAPPSAPVPFVLAAGAPSSQGGGGADAGLAIASAFALLFLYAVFSALRTPPAVPPARGSGANPHPPG